MVFCHFVQFCISYFSKDAATIVNHKVHAKGWHTINLKIKSNFLIWSIGFVCKPQSKYPVLHEGVFVGTGFLFLGRLGSRASTEKKLGANYEQFWRAFFSCFGGQKKIQNFFENPIASALKSCTIQFFSFLLLFLPPKTWKGQFFRDAQILQFKCTT